MNGRQPNFEDIRIKQFLEAGLNRRVLLELSAVECMEGDFPYVPLPPKASMQTLNDTSHERRQFLEELGTAFWDSLAKQECCCYIEEQYPVNDTVENDQRFEAVTSTLMLSTVMTALLSRINLDIYIDVAKITEEQGKSFFMALLGLGLSECYPSTHLTRDWALPFVKSLIPRLLKVQDACKRLTSSPSANVSGVRGFEQLVQEPGSSGSASKGHGFLLE